MTSKLQTVLVFGGVVGGLLLVGACKVTSCPDADGGMQTCVESLVKYKGTGIDKSIAAPSGKNITVVSPNGTVTVNVDAQAGQVTVSATPFAFDSKDGEMSAQNTMNTKLHFNTDEPNGTFTLVQDGGGSYGFDIIVHLPPTFDASIDIEQANGEVTINGVAGAVLTKVVSQNGGITAAGFGGGLYLTTQNGAVAASGGITGPGNLIHTEVGDVDYTLSQGPNLTITAKADSGNVVLPSPVPTGWTVTGASPSETITVGDASGKVDVSSAFGDVTLH